MFFQEIRVDLDVTDKWESFGEFQNSFEDCLSSKIGLLILAESMLIFYFDKRFRESKILVNDHSSLRNKILYCLG